MTNALIRSWMLSSSWTLMLTSVWPEDFAEILKNEAER